MENIKLKMKGNCPFWNKCTSKQGCLGCWIVRVRGVNKIYKIRILFTMVSIPIHEIHVSIRILGHEMCVFVRHICVSEEVYALDVNSNVNSLPNVNHWCPKFSHYQWRPWCQT
jgi:hypothetical protein